MLSMDSLMKIANSKLLDFTAKAPFENQSKTESVKTCNLKPKLSAAREACTITKEAGNEKRAKIKKEPCEKLEDSIESYCRGNKS